MIDPEKLDEVREADRSLESEVWMRAWAGRAAHRWVTDPKHCTIYADAALKAWRERFGNLEPLNFAPIGDPKS